jgi:hypothetical protein
MSLVAKSLSDEVRQHFKLEIERKIFDAAVQGFDSEDNPLRLNNFAFAMRELGRIWLEHLAPKEKIRQCAWFEQNADLRGKDGVTRAQQAKYAVQGPLHDEFVRDELHIDVEKTVKEYTKLIDRLSSFGHDIEKSFNLPSADAQREAMDALDTFDRLATLISERHESLLSKAADEAKEALADELLSEVQSELDILSTHSTVAGVHLDSLTTRDWSCTKYSRQRRLVQRDLPLKNAPAGQRQIRTTSVRRVRAGLWNNYLPAPASASGSGKRRLREVHGQRGLLR